MGRNQSGNSLVSIVIPIYNGERYIEETVQSLLSQTYRELEVICIIDGTSDNSIHILKAFGDPRLQIIEQENRGATPTRNYGLAISTGEYILFLDQDDVMMPDFIQATVQEMVRTGSTAVAVNGYLINADGLIIRRMYRMNKPKLTLNSLLKGNQMSTPSQVLLKRSLLNEVGGFDEKTGMADDWDMWVRQAKKGKIVFLDQYLIQYRLHDSNQSLNVDKMLLNELAVVEHKWTDLSNPKMVKSYSYLRYSIRSARFRSLGVALKLNLSLVLTPRFYWAVCSILWNKRKTQVRARTAQ